MERVKGVFTLNTGNVGDEFRFQHEDFNRRILEMNFKSKELFAPPVNDNYGMYEKGEHTFHFSFKAIWGQ